MLEQTVKPSAVIMLMMIDVVLKSAGGLGRVDIKSTHIISGCVQIMLLYLRVEVRWFGKIGTVYSRG